MTFVDTNVLIDIFDGDSNWVEWSSDRLIDAARTNGAVVNAIVLAEISPSFDSIEHVRSALHDLRIDAVELDDASAFMAGKRFLAYRQARRADDPRRVLPDFFIGAHAATLNKPVLTRDPAIYRRYFPELTLITPENDHD